MGKDQAVWDSEDTEICSKDCIVNMFVLTVLGYIKCCGMHSMMLVCCSSVVLRASSLKDCSRANQIK